MIDLHSSNGGYIHISSVLVHNLSRIGVESSSILVCLEALASVLLVSFWLIYHCRVDVSDH